MASHVYFDEVSSMRKVIREDYYFSEPGKQNTDDVIESVKKRASITGVEHVVVASTTGQTAVRFAEALGNKIDRSIRTKTDSIDFL